MAETTFPGLAGANSNPFSPAGVPKGPMHRLLEEEEGDLTGPPVDPKSPARIGSVAGIARPPPPASTAGDATAATHQRSSDDARHGPSSVSARPTTTSSEGFPSNYALGRRTSVSAESMNPSASTSDSWTPPFHPKTLDQLARLKSAIARNFLFAHLDEEQTAQVLGALVEKPIPAKEIKVITQGDVGDYFYVVERGEFDVYVHPTGTYHAGPDGMGRHVATIGPGGSFGELALMYNAPRAATVVSTRASSCLWALDRLTFRRILMDSTFQRRRMYENFLEEVPLLSTLTPYERSKIADALDSQKFHPDSTIIREGDAGEAFYLLESGEAETFKRGIDGPVTSYRKGDYFGELALLNDAPRAASVVAKSPVKVATLGKDAFQRLLGPVEGIMRRNDPSKRTVPPRPTVSTPLPVPTPTTTTTTTTTA